MFLQRVRCKVIQLVRCRAHQFGLAVASVVRFLAVLMAWYGVNFVLGKGLHSYGFGIGGETYVASFVIADLSLVAIASWRYMASKREPEAEARSQVSQSGREPSVAPTGT